MSLFFRKDFMLYWRNRKELIISLITPIIIIVVLGYALPGWVEKPDKSIEMKAALVQLDDEASAADSFKQALSSEPLADESRLAIEQGMELIKPGQWLEQALGHEQLQSVIEFKRMGYSEAIEQLKDKEIGAVVVIPEGFTLATMNKMLLNTGSGASLNIVAEESSYKVEMLTTIIEKFIHTLNFQIALQQLLGSNGNEAVVNEALSAVSELAVNGKIGGREIISGTKTVTSFQYYSIAISIVFALILSTTIAAKAVTEKRERIFNRILLSDSHPAFYLFGKFSSTFILSLTQIAFILLISHLILNIFPDRSFQFWLGMASILILLALGVGGLAALFTALIFRMEEQLANGIAFLAMLIAGTIGGSFVPIYTLPSWLKATGEWTPNGLALAALLRWLQTETIQDLVMPLISLAIFVVIVLVAAIWVFPRKEQKA